MGKEATHWPIAAIATERLSYKRHTQIAYRSVSAARLRYATIATVVEFLRRERFERFIDVDQLMKYEVARQNLNDQWAVRQASLVRSEVLHDEVISARQVFENLSGATADA